MIMHISRFSVIPITQSWKMTSFPYLVKTTEFLAKGFQEINFGHEIPIFQMLFGYAGLLKHHLRPPSIRQSIANHYLFAEYSRSPKKEKQSFLKFDCYVTVKRPHPQEEKKRCIPRPSIKKGNKYVHHALQTGIYSSKLNVTQVWLIWNFFTKKYFTQAHNFCDTM